MLLYRGYFLWPHCSESVRSIDTTSADHTCIFCIYSKSNVCPAMDSMVVVESVARKFGVGKPKLEQRLSVLCN